MSDCDNLSMNSDFLKKKLDKPEEFFPMMISVARSPAETSTFHNSVSITLYHASIHMLRDI